MICAAITWLAVVPLQVYDMMFETSWRDGPIEVAPWLASYATRRYAVRGSAKSVFAQQAWVALFADVYSSGDTIPTAMLDRPPSLLAGGADAAGLRHGVGLARGWLQLNKAAQVDYGVAVASNNAALLRDIVDVGRGSISDFFNQLHMLFSLEYSRYAGERPRPVASTRALQALAQSMLHCLQQLDEFLGSSPDFLLGTWLADARKSATSESEAELFEFGARNQLMMWGPTPEVGPNPDYACKHWCAWLETCRTIA